MRRLEELHHSRPYYFQPTMRLGDFVSIAIILGGIWHWTGDLVRQVATLEVQLTDTVSRVDRLAQRLDRLTRAAENVQISDPGAKVGASSGDGE